MLIFDIYFFPTVYAAFTMSVKKKNQKKSKTSVISASHTRLWTSNYLTATHFHREYGQGLVLCTRLQKRATCAKSGRSAATWLHAAAQSVSSAAWSQVVRVNIRGRSHCTWLRCPIHPALMESRTAAAHVLQGCKWDREQPTPLKYKSDYTK